MSYQVKITGLDKVVAVAGGAGPQIERTVSQYLNEKGSWTTNQYKNTVPVVSGRYRGSISGRLSAGGLTYTGGSTNVEYANKVEAKFCNKHGQYHHNLADAITSVLAQMRGGEELMIRLKANLAHGFR